MFNRSSSKTLSQESILKKLEFDVNLNSELLLAKKMANSPLILNYMQNPWDRVLFSDALDEILSYQESFRGKNTFFISAGDHRYYSSGEYLYTLDPALSENAWFSATLGIDEEYAFNASYDPVLKQTLLWVNAVTRNEDGKGTGIIGTGINLTDFVDMMYSDLRSGVKMYFYNKAKEISGAEDTSLIEAHAPILNILPDLEKQELFPSKDTVFFKTLKGCYQIVSLPSVDWMMVLFIPYSIVNILRYAAVPFLLVIILAFLVLGAIMIRSIFRPLVVLNDAIKDISSGSADLTKTLSQESVPSGLISEIGGSFNTFIAKLRDIIVSVKTSKETLVESAGKLRGSIDGTVRSIGDINLNIKEMENSISVQAGSVSETSEAVSYIASNISNLNKMIQSQNESVTSASSAVEQMIANIGSVTDSVEKLSDSFTSLEESSNEGVKKQNEVNVKIAEIKSQSEMLRDANRVISSIASQTNLLAMNAAIEAAHAGEAGMGFSVVADEIRKLSENSSAQSKTIGNQLKTIQNSIDEIVAESNESQRALKGISESINVTSEIVQSIMQAMEEQKQGSVQISESLTLLQDSSHEVETASTEIENKNSEILDEAKRLKDNTSGMRDRMGEMTNCASSITRNADSLGTVASDVDSSINKISGEIDLFKV